MKSIARKTRARKKLGRGESQKGEDERWRKSEKMQVREKVRGKSQNTVFFQCFVSPEGRRLGSLKRRVRRQLARWKIKNCTPLWCEADFEVESGKARRVRSTFGSWDVEKVHAVVARSTFWSEHACLKNLGFGPLFDDTMAIRCRESARCRGEKRHHSQQPTSYRFPIFETSAATLCDTYWKYHLLGVYPLILSIPSFVSLGPGDPPWDLGGWAEIVLRHREHFDQRLDEAALDWMV